MRSELPEAKRDTPDEAPGVRVTWSSAAAVVWASEINAASDKTTAIATCAARRVTFSRLTESESVTERDLEYVVET